MAVHAPREGSLNPDEVLKVEFAYIAQTAFQANEDRARVTSLYLITLGGFIAALLRGQVDKPLVPQVTWAFVALFLILVLMSVLTLLQLVRLREAWFDSVQAMNQLKHFYQTNSSCPDLRKAFAWQTTTIPPKYKPWSVGFLLALQVALLGGASAGAAVMFMGLSWGAWPWGWAAALALIGAASQMVLYWILLREHGTAAKVMRPRTEGAREAP